MRGHIKLFALSLDVERTRQFNTAKAANASYPSWNQAALPLIEREFRHAYRV